MKDESEVRSQNSEARRKEVELPIPFPLFNVERRTQNRPQKPSVLALTSNFELFNFERTLKVHHFWFEAMKLVYCDCRGFPLAALAAAIRTGRLPQDGLFEAAALWSLPLITSLQAFVYYGLDRSGHRVYAFWCRSEPLLVTWFFRVREELLRETGGWLLLPVEGIPGGAVLGVAWRLARLEFGWGRKLFYRAVRRCYPHLLQLALKET